MLPAREEGSRMSISADHGQHKDDLRSGRPVLPGQQSSSTRTPHGQQSPLFVCCDDLDASAKQSLSDYRPQGGRENKGLSLPTPEELFRRRLPKQDQLINGKLEQQHTAFAAAEPHMEGAMAANAASSSAPQQAEREFEVRSNSWCDKMPCHEASKKEFAGDWMINCRNLRYNKEGRQVDTKQSRNSAWERWHTTANSTKRGGSLVRTPAAEQVVTDSKAADKLNCVSSGECLVGNRRKPVSVSERQNRLLGFPRICTAEAKLTIKERPNQEPSQNSEHLCLGSDTVDNIVTVLKLPNAFAVTESINLETKQAIQPDRGCLVIIHVIVSRTVESSTSNWPSAAADLLRWSHRLYERQRCTTTSSHLDIVASGSTESSDIVQCNQSQESHIIPAGDPDVLQRIRVIVGSITGRSSTISFSPRTTNGTLV